MTTTWQVTGKGYLKSPDMAAKEGEMLLELRGGPDGWRVFLSENRDFGWAALREHPDNYQGTRGEALIYVDGQQLKGLAETVLKVQALRQHGSS